MNRAPLEVRARAVQVWLDLVASVPALDRRVVETLGAERVRELRASPGVAWLPHRALFDILEAADRYAPQIYLDLSRKSFLAHGDVPMWSALVRIALPLLRGHPERALPLIGRGWPNYFRGVGPIIVARTDGASAQLVITDAAPELVASPVWQRGFAAWFEGLLDAAKCDGVCRARSDVATGALSFELNWVR